MRTEARQGRPLARGRRIVPVVVVTLLGLSVLTDGAGSVVAAVLVLAQAVPLWWRDRRPVLVLLVTTVLDLALVVLWPANLGIGAVAVMIAVYTMYRRPGAAAYTWVGATALASTVVTWLALGSTQEVPAGWELPAAGFRTALAYLVPLLAAEAAGSRARTLVMLRERAELAEREQERTARDAMRQERALMARELHDIAAHHLSGIIVGAQAAGALVASDPDRALDYIRSVAHGAQHTLSNLRQTVGLLRTDDQVGDRPGGTGALAPVPTIAQIPQLVDELRAGGMQIELVWHGDATPLGPVAEAAAYRMVQESLANARRHAPDTPCAVHVAYTAGGTRLSVSNARPAATPTAVPAAVPYGGHGLIGMRERATLTGARLHTGPTADGGWRNELTLPPSDMITRHDHPAGSRRSGPGSAPPGRGEVSGE